MQVPEVPTFEEFFGLVDSQLDDEDFESNISDEDIKEMVIVLLALLQEFYLEVQYATEYYILTETFKNQISKLNLELKEQLLVLFTEYSKKIASDLDLKWNIPSDVVDNTIDFEEIIDSSIDSVTDTLYADLKDKATFYKEMAIVSGVFTLHSNFRRAIRKLTNVVNYNAQYLNNRIIRNYDTFVYGQEALFYWICSGRNTCAWCYSIEAESPLPLSMLPVDHPNGHCTVEPVFPEMYSDEYLEIIQE